LGANRVYFIRRFYCIFVLFKEEIKKAKELVFKENNITFEFLNFRKCRKRVLMMNKVEEGMLE
jgi:hypothetical protein